MSRSLVLVNVLMGLSLARLFGGGAPEDSGAGVLVDGEGIAVYGVDVVAYHDLEPGEPAVEGSPEHSTRWRGAEWRFSSRENLRRFEEDPERYAPEYGGYCAWAMADGDRVKVDPDAWTIRDSRLYLNYGDRIRTKWLKNAGELIRRADERWPGVRDELGGESR